MGATSQRDGMRLQRWRMLLIFPEVPSRRHVKKHVFSVEKDTEDDFLLSQAAGGLACLCVRKRSFEPTISYQVGGVDTD